MDRITAAASPEERKRLFGILSKHHAAFTTLEEQLGTFPHAEHSIKLRDEIPVTSQPYRCSPADREFIKQQVENYWERGIVRQKQSEYAASTLVVNQPNDPATPRRMVHDCRKLNVKTINPLQSMDDALDDVMRDGSHYVTVIDVKTAFLTTRVKPEDVHKTALSLQMASTSISAWPSGSVKRPQPCKW